MHTDDVFAKIFAASGSIVALWALEAFLQMYQLVSAKNLRLFTCEAAVLANVLLPRVQSSVRIEVAHSFETETALFTHVRLCVAVRELMS